MTTPGAVDWVAEITIKEDVPSGCPVPDAMLSNNVAIDISGYETATLIFSKPRRTPHDDPR